MTTTHNRASLSLEDVNLAINEPLWLSWETPRGRFSCVFC
jgi:hypothetical protein